MIEVSWRLRPELDHVGVLAEGQLAALRCDLHRGRRVGVLHDHVGALVEQRLGGVGFLAGVEPGVHPDDLDLDVRIDRLRAEHRGVDARDHFRDRERGDVAEHAGLRHLGGDHALDVAALVEAAGIGATCSCRACSRWRARTCTLGYFFATFSVGSM